MAKGYGKCLYEHNELIASIWLDTNVPNQLKYQVNKMGRIWAKKLERGDGK